MNDGEAVCFFEVLKSYHSADAIQLCVACVRCVLPLHMLIYRHRVRFIAKSFRGNMSPRSIEWSKCMVMWSYVHDKCNFTKLHLHASCVYNFHSHTVNTMRSHFLEMVPFTSSIEGNTHSNVNLCVWEMWLHEMSLTSCTCGFHRNLTLKRKTRLDLRSFSLKTTPFILLIYRIVRGV